MISFREALLARSMIRSALTAPTCIQFHQTKPSAKFIATRTFSTGELRKKKMGGKRNVVNYDDVMKSIEHPNKVIIDVRNPDEVSSTGQIPSSINIPLGNVENVLASMSETDFKKHYNRSKPQHSSELIFYCRSGRRASEAVDKALRLGYSNSKTYIGSWEEWSNKTKR